MLPDCRCFINSFAQAILGTPDVKSGLQAAFDLANAKNSEVWAHSLARALLDALVHVQTMAHAQLPGNIEAFVHAMERNSNVFVKDLVEWVGLRYGGVCFTAQ